MISQISQDFWIFLKNSTSFPHDFQRPLEVFQDFSHFLWLLRVSQDFSWFFNIFQDFPEFLKISQHFSKFLEASRFQDFETSQNCSEICSRFLKISHKFPDLERESQLKSDFSKFLRDTLEIFQQFYKNSSTFPQDCLRFLQISEGFSRFLMLSQNL